jgi:hypothetical protein
MIVKKDKCAEITELAITWCKWLWQKIWQKETCKECGKVKEC